MNWWIVEDALRDRDGHWAEYLETFRRGLVELGDSVCFLVDRTAEPWIVDQFAATACLPESIWHRISTPTSGWQRMLRIPHHAHGTIRAVKGQLSHKPVPDLIFVPTVLVHHLLGWWRLIEGPLKKHPTCRVLLFFPNTMVQVDRDTRQAYLPKSPTGRLFLWLIRQLGPAVESGRVVLGAETLPMCDAMEQATGFRFTYLPHPVHAGRDANTAESENRGIGKPNGTILLGAYGTARHEKGSDVLQKAVAEYLRRTPNTPARFSIQWLSDFDDEEGLCVRRDPFLERHPNVEFITDYFVGDGYTQQLGKTDVMLLPYRRNYELRVSRVVIEAMLHGIPVIATQSTTLYDQAKRGGAVVGANDGDVDSVVAAIAIMVEQFQTFKSHALNRQPYAAAHFSVSNFRQLLVDCVASTNRDSGYHRKNGSAESCTSPSQLLQQP